MYRITIQHAVKSRVPPNAVLRKWVKAALKGNIAAAELTLRIVGAKEMSALNLNYRHHFGPTNVLSFAFEAPEGIELARPILGDIVICAAYVTREAKRHQMPWTAHWAHIVIHGVFHLLGFDHENDRDAQIMEAKETAVMQQLGYGNPYELENT